MDGMEEDEGASGPYARFRIALGASLTLATLAGGWMVYEAATWPDVAALTHGSPESTAFIQRYQERCLAEPGLPPLAWQPVPYDSIAAMLKWTVVVAEDIEFFWHRGFSPSEMRRAIRDALSGRRGLRGASTITQQLAKNLWLTPSRNPLRKLKEALLTRQLESRLGKQRILELYLNVVEFGPGVFGAEAAARRYYGKRAAALSLQEATQLVAALPRPATWHPGSTGSGYQRYVELIRRRLYRASSLERYLPAIELPPRIELPPPIELPPAALPSAEAAVDTVSG